MRLAGVSATEAHALAIAALIRLTAPLLTPHRVIRGRVRSTECEAFFSLSSRLWRRVAGG